MTANDLDYQKLLGDVESIKGTLTVKCACTVCYVACYACTTGRCSKCNMSGFTFAEDIFW